MATLVCFHAHPDDESITTGGTMAAAAAAGHRVVLVVATRGERGEVPDGLLRPGEALWQRRVDETLRSAEILGVARVEFLGYVDSGMMGDPGNDDPASFWQADVDAAADRLAALLVEEAADVVTIYDANGNYGHPDHIQVHRVGVLATELAGSPAVYEATMNRDHIRGLLEVASAQGIEVSDAGGDPMGPDDVDFGVSADTLTHRVDVSDFVEHKRASMRAHASQIGDQSMFLTMADEVFALAFGTEWFTQRGVDLPVAQYADSILS